jgi:hypothetical protein
MESGRHTARCALSNLWRHDVRRRVYSALALSAVSATIAGLMTRTQFQLTLGTLAVAGTATALLLQHQALGNDRD